MPRPDRISRDRGLIVRMVLVMAYLAAVMLAGVALVVARFGGVGLIAVMLGLLLLVALWFSSGSTSMRKIGARLVTAESDPALHGALQRMCALSGVPVPRLALQKAWDPNAFTLGRSPKHAAIVLTRPLVELLEPHELEAVLAHELAHLAHRDLLVMNIASSPRNLRSLLGTMMGDSLRGAVILLPAWVFVGVLELLCHLPMRLLSRYRELQADLAAAQVTQRPGNLASALQRITGGTTPIPSQDIRSRAAIDTFGIVAPAGVPPEGLGSTHPKLEDRLAQLARVAADLSRPTG